MFLKIVHQSATLNRPWAADQCTLLSTPDGWRWALLNGLGWNQCVSCSANQPRQIFSKLILTKYVETNQAEILWCWINNFLKRNTFYASAENVGIWIGFFQRPLPFTSSKRHEGSAPSDTYTLFWPISLPYFSLSLSLALTSSFSLHLSLSLSLTFSLSASLSRSASFSPVQLTDKPSF